MKNSKKSPLKSGSESRGRSASKGDD